MQTINFCDDAALAWLEQWQFRQLSRKLFTLASGHRADLVNCELPFITHYTSVMSYFWGKQGVRKKVKRLKCEKIPFCTRTKSNHVKLIQWSKWAVSAVKERCFKGRVRFFIIIIIINNHYKDKLTRLGMCIRNVNRVYFYWIESKFTREAKCIIY